MTYVDFRTANCDQYLKAHSFLGLFPTFGPLRDHTQFNAVHRASMLGIAQYSQKQPVYWATCGDESNSQLWIDIVEAVAEIAISIAFPPLAALAPYIVEGIEAAVKYVVRLLMGSIHTELIVKGTYGASLEQHQSQVTEWSKQAT